jgi:CheY-like chemotaxis protein
MLSVLVVEDDVDLQFLYNAALSQRGYQVMTAETAGSAVHLLTGRPFDVVVLDLNLPDAHGSVVVDYIEQNNLHPLERVIVVTANQLWAGSMSERGLNHVYVKPISMMRLVEIIQGLTLHD